MGVMLRCLVPREGVDMEQVFGIEMRTIDAISIIELRDHGACLLHEYTIA